MRRNCYCNYAVKEISSSFSFALGWEVGHFYHLTNFGKLNLFSWLLFCDRAPDVLKALAPGSQPPFLLFNDEVKTDTNKIEEFLEEKLAPPE